MKKNIIKLNESQLRKIVTESVQKILKEGAIDVEGTPYTFEDFLFEINKLKNAIDKIDYSPLNVKETMPIHRKEIPIEILNTMQKVYNDFAEIDDLLGYLRGYASSEEARNNFSKL